MACALTSMLMGQPCTDDVDVDDADVDVDDKEGEDLDSAVSLMYESSTALVSGVNERMEAPMAYGASPLEAPLEAPLENPLTDADDDDDDDDEREEPIGGFAVTDVDGGG